MKAIRIKTFFACMTIPFAVFSQDGNFTIRGKISPRYNNQFVKLYYANDTIKVVDSVSIAKGRFELKGYVHSPTLGRLSLDKEDTGDRIDLFLSEGTIQVIAKDSLHEAQINGTQLGEDHERFAKRIRPLEKEIVDKLKRYSDMPEGDAKKAYFAKFITDLDEYNRNKREIVHEFVTENPTSYVSLYHLDKTVLGRLANYETTYPVFIKLSPELRETPVGRQLGERLLQAKGQWTGQPYKDFISTTPDGKQLTLKEIVSTNRYTLVDFWASWCGPCRKENPHVVKTYNAFKDKGFTVLSVSLDSDAERWKDAIEKDGMPWHHVSSLMGWKEPAAVLYGVRAIPQNILIDAEGKIVAANLRAETLFTKVKQLIDSSEKATYQ